MPRSRTHLLVAVATVLIAGCSASQPAPSQTPTTVATATPSRPTPSRPTPSPVTPSPVTPAPIPAKAPFGAAARVHLEALANGIGAREPGSAEEARAAAYIASALGNAGYSVSTQRFSFGRGGQHSSANVIAVKAGTSRREIIIGAHYDSVDDGDGADDNASGVGILLEVAARIRNVATPYTIRLIAFGAEEADDFYGSRHAVSQMEAAERASVVAMVNLDSLVSGDIPYVYGDDAGLVSWVLKAGQTAELDLQAYPVSALHQDSDYFSYQQAGIPFLYFEATNWNLGDRDGFTRVDPRFGDEGEIIHTRYDTLAYLDATFPGRIDGHLARYARVLNLFVTQYGR